MTNTSWLEQVQAVSAHVQARLDALGETDRVHVETLTEECQALSTISATTLKLLVSSYIDSVPGFKVSRGKFGGAMRDTEANLPKAVSRAVEVEMRREERAAKRAQRDAEKAAKPVRAKRTPVATTEVVAETPPANDQDVVETEAQAV